MTHEEFNKHKEAINWFYAQPEGTEIYAQFNDEHNWSITNNPSWSLDFKYVINDEYSEFRKALADNTTVQCNLHSDCVPRPTID